MEFVNKFLWQFELSMGPLRAPLKLKIFKESFQDIVVSSLFIFLCLQYCTTIRGDSHYSHPYNFSFKLEVE